MLKGKTIYHCHGKAKGKKYRSYKTRAKAKRAHKAIMARKKGNPYSSGLKKSYG